MKRSTWSVALLETIFLALAAAGPAAAANEIGKTVALRGKAFIERGKQHIEAKVKSPIELNDTVTTGEASKIKLLFIDDSVLTLAEKSRFSVKEFVHSKEARGKSIFNLIDGKMRAVVGKTKFEVQTPTAVAAARGTVIFFEVGMIGNNPFTRIICLEGTVGVTSTLPATTPGAPSPPPMDLRPGMMVTVVAGETAPPAPTPAPPAVIERLRQETTTRTSETTLSQTGAFQVEEGSTLNATTTTVTVTGSTTTQAPAPTADLTPPPPPVNYTPPKQPIGVNLNIRIPVYTPPAP